MSLKKPPCNSVLEILRLGINGEGVAKEEGYTVFVDDALPGETVSVSFYEKRKSFGRAKVSNYTHFSSKRVKPPCPLFGSCGGCQLMHMDPESQLDFKRDRVIDALQRIGHFKNSVVEKCIPSQLSLNYRNKIQLPVVEKNGKLELGLYARNSHDVIPISSCHIHCELGERAFLHVKNTLQSSSIKGTIKTVLIKTAVHTEQILVILITKSDAVGLEDLAIKIIAGMPNIKGVIQNIKDDESNTVLGNTYRLLAGQENIEEILCGLKFKVSPASFFQVNPIQAENLYHKVIEYAEPSGGETVLDAYCGVGTLSLLLAGCSKQVIGIECVSQAIEDARENAVKNHITNIDFILGQAEEMIQKVENIDVAVLNPPRKGCERILLERLLVLKPKKILYVSCDPATLARDLGILCEKDYQIEKVQPFDMFPQTAHVETLVLLRQN